MHTTEPSQSDRFNTQRSPVDSERLLRVIQACSKTLGGKISATYLMPAPVRPNQSLVDASFGSQSFKVREPVEMPRTFLEKLALLLNVKGAPERLLLVEEPQRLPANPSWNSQTLGLDAIGIHADQGTLAEHPDELLGIWIRQAREASSNERDTGLVFARNPAVLAAIQEQLGELSDMGLELINKETPYSEQPKPLFQRKAMPGAFAVSHRACVTS